MIISFRFVVKNRVKLLFHAYRLKPLHAAIIHISPLYSGFTFPHLASFKRLDSPVPAIYSVTCANAVLAIFAV